jgi:hypothetical protein
MSRPQWLASAAIVFHLAALAVAAIPAPHLFDHGAITQSSRDTAPAPAVGAAFDALARHVSALQRALYRAATPFRVVTAPYLAAGFGNQRWSMFSKPFLHDHYVVVEHWLVDDAGARTRLRELVLPEDDEDEVRWSHSYRDKAILNILEGLSAGLESRRARGEAGLEIRDLAQDDELLQLIEPVARWATHRIRVEEGQTLLRTAVWLGEAPNPPPGALVPQEERDARREVIATFRAGRRDPLPATARPDARGAMFRDHDVLWTLIYVDAR